MLTNAQLKLIKKLHTKKGRIAHRSCLVEGAKAIAAAGTAMQFTFTPADVPNFDELVTTTTPQPLAGVANLPQYTLNDIQQCATIILLDGVQDPGNVGAIARLCSGFACGLILVESADITSPKVIRSSAGMAFTIPWITSSKLQLPDIIKQLQTHTWIRLEKTNNSQPLTLEKKQTLPNNIVIVAGSEGNGITETTPGESLHIPHAASLESLNVANAVAMFLAIYHCS